LTAACARFVSRCRHRPTDADPEHTEAEYRHGVLTVRVPKLAAAKPRQIAVKVA